MDLYDLLYLKLGECSKKRKSPFRLLFCHGVIWCAVHFRIHGLKFLQRKPKAPDANHEDQIENSKDRKRCYQETFLNFCEV